MNRGVPEERKADASLGTVAGSLHTVTGRVVAMQNTNTNGSKVAPIEPLNVKSVQENGRNSLKENVTLVEPFDANSNGSGDENSRPLWPPTVPDSVGPEEHETIMRSILYPPPDTQIGEAKTVSDRQEEVVPVQMVMCEPAPKERAAEGEEDWDDRKGLLAWCARMQHDHYYISTIVFVVVTLGLTAVILVAPANPNCTTKGPQFTVCEASGHDWEISVDKTSLFKDALKAARAGADSEFKKITGRTDDVAISPRSKRSDNQGLIFIYNHERSANKDTSIFTPARVQVTQRDPASSGCALLSADTVKQGADAILSQNAGWGGFFLSDAATDKKFTNKTRANIALGSPLAGFKNEDDNKEMQGNLYEMFYAGLDCAKFTENVLKVGKYAGPNPCEGKASDYYFKGLEASLLGRFGIKGVPAQDFPSEKQAFLKAGSVRSGYMGADPKVETADGVMQVRFWSLAFQQVEFGRVVDGDLYYSIISIAVVWCYCVYHTNSCFLASFFMFQILMSLPVGYFCYYNIFRIQFYSQVNILAIYLALGIGADSVFVMFDAWKQSLVMSSIRTTRGRLTYALDRTCKACFNTTLTTVAAFGSTAWTGIMPIHCFAIFALTVLVVDYIFAVVFSPTIIMIYHVHFSDLGGACCCCGKNWKRCGAPEPAVTEPTKAVRDSDLCYKACCYSKWSADPALVEQHVKQEEGKSEVDRMRATERFFQNAFSRLIIGKDLTVGQWKPFAYLFIALGLGVGLWMIVMAAKLAPPVSQEEWFPKQHMYTDIIARLTENWLGGQDDDYMKLFVVFGINGFERGGLSKEKNVAAQIDPFNWYFPTVSRGFVTYDDTFDLSKQESQLFFMETCAAIKKIQCSSSFSYMCRPSNSFLRPNSEVVCVVKDLLDFYRLDSGDPTAEFVPTAQFASNYEKFITGKGKWNAYYSQLPSAAKFTFPVNDLTPMDNPMLPADKKADLLKAKDGILQLWQGKYKTLIGRSSGLSDVTKTYMWATIEFRSVILVPIANGVAHAAYDVMEAWVMERRAIAPAGMKSVFQTDDQVPALGWTWMIVEDGLVANLLQGFMLCFPFCFVVLVLVVGNYFIALYAICTIALIVGCVLGFAYYSGWSLGVAESIAGVIVIGFSVDYTLHLGHIYKEASMLGAKELKTQHALTVMGASVIGGAFTTLVCGLVLYMCTLTFFTKMASLLVWTILVSVYYSLFFFMSMCAVFGPPGKWGDVYSCCGLIKSGGEEGVSRSAGGVGGGGVLA